MASSQSDAHNGGHSVMSQFDITPIFAPFGDTLAFTNSALWMLISVAVVCFVLWGGMRPSHNRSLVPGRWGIIAETIYGVVVGIMRETVGSDGRPYFPFVLTLYTFILAANLLGLIPGSFTVTSHLSVNLSLALFIFTFITLLAIVKKRWGFLRLFFPADAPWWSGIILVPVEVVSYLSRPISLSVRLFANMTVGHVLLKVVGGFVFALGLGGIIPLAALVAITGLEILIALVHAYVFAILSCVYLSDALHDQH